MKSKLNLRLTEDECLKLIMMATPERPLGMTWRTDGAGLQPDWAGGIEELKKIRSTS